MSLTPATPRPRSHRLPEGRPAASAPRILAWLVIICACDGYLNAESLETWNETEYTVARSSRFEVTVEGVHRFGKTVGDLYDRRFATKFEYNLGKGVSVGAGHVFRHRDVGVDSLNENRFTAGISYPIWTRAIEIEGSTIYERILVPTSDFNRYKQQFEIFQPGKTLSPWFYQQLLFRQGAGFTRSRSRFGLKWRRSRYSVKAAYQFESISKGSAWTPRHSIYTEVGIDHPLWFRE